MNDSLLLHLSEWGLVTRVPTRDVWKRLSAYESSDLVRRILKERHGRIPTAAKALEVAAHVTQGRQYFEAAAEAAALTRPLLLYYGVLSLSRAVILCADVNRREATLAGAHGLSCVDWSGVLADGGTRLSDLEIAMTGGTFAELCLWTRNRERSLVYSHHRLRSSLVQEGTVKFGSEVDRKVHFTLKEILARIPDLADLFQMTFGEVGACHPAYIHVYPELQTDYYLFQTQPGIPCAEHVRQAFGLPSDFSIELSDYDPFVGHVPGISFHINRNISPVEIRTLVLPIKNDRVTLPYVVEPLPGNVILSSLSLLFVISHAMGMLVRYHPSHWVALTGPAKGNAMLPLLNAAARLVEDRFPELVLEEFEQSHPGTFLYRHPSLA